MEVSPNSKPNRLFSRRRFLITGTTLGAGTAGYGWFLESEWLEVGRTSISLAPGKFQRSFTLLHLSDLHASRYVRIEYLETALDLAHSLRPDLICLTGDFLTGKFFQMKRYAAVLSRLAASAPAYACLGNHDGKKIRPAPHGDWSHQDRVRNLLKETGIHLLHNDLEIVQTPGGPLCLAGVGDLWGKECDPEKTFKKQPEDGVMPTFLLAHNPDCKDKLIDHRWDLMLSGHTHGGQVNLPLLGPAFAPVEDLRFIHGLHRWENRWLYITKGVGNLYGFRLNCRPEISLLTIS